MKLVKLYKPSCNPCEMVSNFLNDAGVTPDEEHDIMQNSEVAVKYGVMGVPVLILTDDEGNEVQRSNGFNPPEIQQIISKLK